MSSLRLNDWIFECKSNTPILNSSEVEDLANKFSFPLPGILFGNNYLMMRNERSDFSLSFNLQDCLNEIPKKASAHSVHAAKEWKPSRIISALPHNPATYDWTYFSQFEGTVQSKQEWQPSPAMDGINMELLKACDDFLFFHSFLLFEDELADSGHTSYSVKIRIMPTCIFILATSSCRIDFVWEGRREIRYFYEFGCECLVKNIRNYVEKQLVDQAEFQMKIIL